MQALIIDDTLIRRIKHFSAAGIQVVVAYLRGAIGSKEGGI